MKPEEHVKNLAAIAKRLLNETDDVRSFKAQYHLMKVIEALEEENPRLSGHFHSKVTALKLVE